MMDVVVVLGAAMRVEVPVRDAIMVVSMTVDAQRSHQGSDAHGDQCEPNESLDPRGHGGREPPTGEHEHSADHHNHQGMPDPPARSDRERTAPVWPPTHKHADRGEVIGGERVRGAKEQSGDEERTHAGSNSSATSIDEAEWVSAPIEIQSTPVIAIDRTVSRVTPPDASTVARPSTS